jgi:hypothetical protein
MQKVGIDSILSYFDISNPQYAKVGNLAVAMKYMQF